MRKLVTNEEILTKIENVEEFLKQNEIGLSYAQAAPVLGYTVKTLYTKVSKGEIPVRKTRGSRPRIYLSDLQTGGAI